MDKLSQRQRMKIDEVERILNKRDSIHPSISSISSHCTNLSDLSFDSSSTSSSASFIIANTNGSDTSFNVNRGVDANVIGNNSNQKYDDNSTLLDALRDSESAQQIDLDYSYVPYPSKDVTWDFPASVEITYEPSKMERLAHAIFYSIATDNVTWIWVAMYLLTYR
jgi:hypothetical protein